MVIIGIINLQIPKGYKLSGIMVRNYVRSRNRIKAKSVKWFDHVPSAEEIVELGDGHYILHPRITPILYGAGSFVKCDWGVIVQDNKYVVLEKHQVGEHFENNN